MKTIRIKKIPSEPIRSAIYFNVKVICGNVEKELREMILESIEVEDNINIIKFEIWKAEIPDSRFDNDEYETEVLYDIKDGDIIESCKYATLNRIEIHISEKRINLKWKRSRKRGVIK